MARIKYWNETSQAWEYADKSLQINNNLLIDKTLTVEGRAADAKAVGDAIANLDSNKLDSSSLNSAINTALTQAKKSGEFDGKDGKTPVKGVDYWTANDKSEMVEDVLAEVAEDETLIDNVAEVVKAEVPLVKTAEQPNFANSTAEMTDKTKVYVMLPVGYMYRHREKKNYNLLKPSEVTYNARLDNASSEIMASTLNAVSGWFPVTYGKYYAPSIYRSDLGKRIGYNLKFARVQLKLADGSIKIYTNANGGNEYPHTSLPAYSNSAAYGVDDENAVAMRVHFSITINSTQQPLSKSEELRTHQPMIVEGDTVEDAMLNTLNLEYIDGDEAGIAEWYNTGLMYNLPADYEARILELESLVEELQNSEKNEIYGKTILNFGDSIAEGGANNNRNYCTIIGEKYNMPVISVAVGGAIMARNTGLGATKYILNQIESAITSQGTTNFDFIVLEGGTNDLQYLDTGTEQMGAVTDAYDGNYDETTAIGALEKAFYLIRTTWLSSNIIFVIPHTMSSRDYDKAKQLWSEYVAVCKKWGVPVANVYEEGQYNTYIASMNALYAKPSDTTETGYDRTHPNEDGYKKWYCPLIVSKMKEIVFE